MKRLILSFLPLLAAAISVPGAPLVIVDQGQPMATIVVETNNAQSASAGSEIQKYVEKISGVKLPLIKEGNSSNAPMLAVTILVGHTEAAKKLGVKIPSGYDRTIRKEFNEEEGYVIQTKGNSLILGGNSDGQYQGTMYAAYALLETLGCRWYFPGEWGQVIPENKTVTVPDLHIDKRPDFAVRSIVMDGRWGATMPDRAEYAAWSTKIGLSSGRMYPVPGDGYLAYALPPKEYATAHPEWYAMNKQGIRDVKNTTPMQNVMLCLSNKEMFDEYLKNVKDAFSGKRRVPSVNDLGIGISPPDGAPYCYCDQCMAASQDFNYPTYVQERMQSEEVYNFAGKLADEFPEKWVTVSAYSLREAPPQGVKLRPNMSVMLAPISCCVLHANDATNCWRRQEFTEILTEWLRQSPHVWLYDYTPGFLVSSFEPEAEIDNFAINAKLYKKAGLKGFGRQGSNAMMATWLGYYAASKFMWDVNSDLDAIKRDFYDTFFGPDAGPKVQAWWDACSAALRNSNMHVHESWLVNHIYSAEFARSIHKYVDQARTAKMTDKQRERFQAFELIVENFEANADMEEAAKNLDYKKAAEGAQRMITARDALNKISVFLIGKGAQTSPAPYYTRGRMNQYLNYAQMTTGTNGTMVSGFPMETKFARDPYNTGVFGRWYATDFQDDHWGKKNTYYTWDQQDAPEDAIGHDYDGYGWYRADFDVPASMQGKPLHYHCGGALNEAWVWVNGQYVGHRPNVIWWMGNNDFDMDITKFAHPGGKNQITIRIYNDTQIGGLLRRGFFWSPTLTADAK